MILRLLAAELAVLGTQLLLFSLFLGVGLLLRRRFGLHTVSVEDALRTFWVGFALVLLLLLTWNFFRPIDEITMAVVLGLGATGLYSSRRDFAFDRRESIRLAIVMLPIGLWMAGISVEPLLNWDDGLYHVQGVRWAEEHRVVPGIANLFGPLAFNNTSFLYAALLEVGPWEDRAYHIANGLLVFVLASQAIRAGLALMWDQDGESRGRVFDLVLLVPAVAFVQPDIIASYVTDLPTAVVLLAALSAWYTLITRERSEPDAGVPTGAGSCTTQGALRSGWLAVTVGILCAAAVCLKQNAALLSGIVVPLSFVSWLVVARPSRFIALRAARFTGLIVLGLGLSWTARGVIQSGYPLFPQPIAAFPVAWRAPREHAEAELAYAIHSARTDTGELTLPGAERPFSWWPHWLGSPTPKLYELWVPLGVLLLGLTAIGLWRDRSAASARGPPGIMRWMMPPIAIASTVWFIVAPAPRYGMFLFWGAAAITLAEAFHAVAGRWPESRRTFAGTLACALLVLGLSSPVVQPALAAGEDEGFVAAIVRANLNRPGDSLLEPMPPPPTLSEYVTDSGLRLLVPERRCVAAPLPCTPNPSPNLEQRGFGLLGTGFVVSGGWQMRDWPYWWRSDFLPAWRSYRQRRERAD